MLPGKCKVGYPASNSWKSKMTAEMENVKGNTVDIHRINW